METLRKIQQQRLEIIKIIENLGGALVHVYGSVAKGTDSPESDIDLLINCQKDTNELTMIAVASMTGELESLLGRKVHIHVRRLLKREVVRTLIGNTIPL